ncbi:hypothetical protein O9G_000298 [Rozella allomycis CSF55]|uniref:Vacuolar protein sorting-associated protein 51 homolog n=1 Tax=Rozella allomycis (strain CSF55) TaxID=988480 RepID=A0A075AP61_ROZAC|nr:hypothetical protein O9G_000298 [Rozella allomycis CSF55]|eukprot:EPZ31819.1 hypothetical protein O9G_000298 [Rozella allomycis CSF55]
MMVRRSPKRAEVEIEDPNQPLGMVCFGELIRYDYMLGCTDHAEFNADTYISSMLANKGFEELTIELDDLDQQIKRFEVDTKTLVYDNYTRFIKATDTISDMKNDVEQMEKSMTSLLTQMNEMSQDSSAIHERFSERRVRINQLCEAQNMVKKRLQIQYILELPTYLQRNISKKSSWKALVHNYSWMMDSLQNKDHIDSFAKIKREATEIIAPIKDEAYKKVTLKSAGKIKMEDLIESCSILVGIKENPLDISQSLISSADTILKKISSSLPLKGTYNEQLENVNSQYIKPMTPFLIHFHFIFMSEFEKNPNTEIQDLLPGLHKVLLSTQEYDTLKANLLAQANEWLNNFCELLKNILKEEKDWPVLISFFHDVNEIAMVSDQNHCVDIFSTTKSFILSFFINNIQKKFVNLSSSLMESFDKNDEIAPLTDNIMNSYTMIINDIQPVLRSEFSYMKSYSHDILLTCQTLLKQSLTDFVNYLGNLSVLDTKLLLKQVSVLFELNISILDKIFVHFSESLFIGKGGLRNWMSQVAPIKLEAIQLAQKCLELSVRLTETSTLDILETFLDNQPWLQYEIPTGHSSDIVRCINIVQNFNSFCNTYLPKAPSKKNSSSQKSGSDSRKSKNNRKSTFDDQLSANIDKIFSERIVIFAPITIDNTCPVMQVCRSFLKAWTEYVRMKTLNANGFNQIQIDAEQFRIALWKMDNENETLMTLLDDVISNAYKRSINPRPLSPNICVMNSLARQSIRPLARNSLTRYQLHFDIKGSCDWQGFEVRKSWLGYNKAYIYAILGFGAPIFHWLYNGSMMNKLQFDAIFILLFSILLIGQ